MVHFTLRPLYPCGRRQRSALDVRLGGLHYRSGHCGEQKDLLSLPRGYLQQFSVCLVRKMLAITNKPHRWQFQDVASTDVAGSHICNDITFRDWRSEARTDISRISNHRITPHHRRIKFLAQRIPNIRQYVKVSSFIFTKGAEYIGPLAPTCILETPRCYVAWFIGKCGLNLLWFVLVPPVKCRLIPWNGSWLTALLITEHTRTQSRLNRRHDFAE